MKRFFVAIGRFFWSWGFLKFVLAILALIVLLYVEEDWRGAHAWAVTKAKWEAQGETFDYAKFIPPPVPDDQNLAAIPLFELKADRSSHNQPILRLPNLEKALRNDGPYADIPQQGNWMKGEPPDKEKIQKTLSEDYAKFFKGQSPPTDSLALFDVLFPFTGDLRAAALTHTQFRFNTDYMASLPHLRPLGPIVKGIALSRIFTLHAVLALDHGQPELALGDIKTSYIITKGIANDPSLVGGLVAIGCSALSLGGVYHGLAYHLWNDQQLVELDKTLGDLNFLESLHFCLRAEVSEDVRDSEFFKIARTSEIPPMAYDATYTEALLFRWPSGWWDSNTRQLVDFHFHQIATVDANRMLVFPVKDEQIKNEIGHLADRTFSYAPWNVWFTEASVAETAMMIKFAQGQVWIDEARIACALERYRLVYGKRE